MQGQLEHMTQQLEASKMETAELVAENSKLHDQVGGVAYALLYLEKFLR